MITLTPPIEPKFGFSQFNYSIESPANLFIWSCFLIIFLVNIARVRKEIIRDISLRFTPGISFFRNPNASILWKILFKYCVIGLDFVLFIAGIIYSIGRNYPIDSQVINMFYLSVLIIVFFASELNPPIPEFVSATVNLFAILFVLVLSNLLVNYESNYKTYLINKVKYDQNINENKLKNSYTVQIQNLNLKLKEQESSLKDKIYKNLIQSSEIKGCFRVLIEYTDDTIYNKEISVETWELRKLSFWIFIRSENIENLKQIASNFFDGHLKDIAYLEKYNTNDEYKDHVILKSASSYEFTPKFDYMCKIRKNSLNI